MQTGAAAAYTEPETDQTPQVHLTPRTRQIVMHMLPCFPGGRPKWWRAATIAKDTEIPVGTVSPLLSRLEGARWVESERVDDTHHRQYRLTADGVAGARGDLVDVDDVDAAVVEPARPPAQRRHVEDVDENRVWTMTELAAANAGLAAIVRRRMAAESAE